MLTYSLEWPSLTVEWLPGVIHDAHFESVEMRRMLLGTHTDSAVGNEDRLIVAQIYVPWQHRYLPDHHRVHGSGSGHVTNPKEVRHSFEC